MEIQRQVIWLGPAAVLAAVAVLGALMSGRPAPPAGDDLFLYRVIDAAGPAEPWGKSVGDLNGDGRPDVLIGGHGSDELVWYASPDWPRATIATGKAFSTDHEVADVDGDGRNDVVSIAGEELVWYRNPDWTETSIAKEPLHDIEVADLDGDGDQDVVGRDQGAFGGSGAAVFIYEQEAPDRWRASVLEAPDGEGLKVADLDGDGDPDIIVNAVWFENPGALAGAAWQDHVYSRSWTWPHAFIDAGDIDGDGRPDLVLSPAEPAEEYHRLSWFRAPEDPKREWREHVIQDDVETLMHFVGLADLDGDGDLDVAGAEVVQSDDPDDITVYLNGGGGLRWFPMVLATTGSHSMRLADLDLDGDVDLFGANWSGDHQPVELWENRTCPQASPWHRHALDEELPWTAVFVTAADLDQDGFQDVIAGAWWYRNPGLVRRPWERSRLGPGIAQVAAVVDPDKDGVPDLIATLGAGDVQGGDLAWVRNRGDAAFAAPEPVAETQGDFLQGVATGDFAGNGETQIALSWHAAGLGVQLLSAPGEARWPWELETISAVSQDEALSSGDIDRDGDLDLLLGTKWLENAEGAWTLHDIEASDAKPDRNRLADINGDGRLDAVVGFEALGEIGDIVWYEQPEDPRAPWPRRPVASITGPMSLDAVDLDRDGDLDIVAGEHDMASPEEAGLFWFANLDGRGHQWERHLIYRGDEHHDGALAVDLDNDGDLDVVSIGWGHDELVAYENRMTACGGTGPDQAGRRSSSEEG